MRLFDRQSLILAGGGLAVIALVAGVILSRPKPPAPASPPVAAAKPTPAPSATPSVAAIPEEGRVLAHAGQPLQLPGAPVAIASMLDVPQQMSFGDSLWREKGVPDGPLWIRVDRDAQVISVFRGPHEIGTAVILYGAPEKPTPPGRYPILARMKEHRSSLYDADMPYTLRLTEDGIAIHASNVREGRATHGCIGLPEDFARKLFDLARKGDAVFIV